MYLISVGFYPEALTPKLLFLYYGTLTTLLRNLLETLFPRRKSGYFVSVFPDYSNFVRKVHVLEKHNRACSCNLIILIIL